ncbi:hypothetical protein [Cupriavidus sp. a3]|uniref:hypothetical protein n=1 Tax=Cupriavidus sp. a3 TaxID=3242158 RepID=UPI003D9C6371
MTENNRRYVNYEDPAFIEICDQFFSNNQEFILICNDKSLEKCRYAAELYLRYDLQRPKKKWDNLKSLARLGAAGMKVLPLMVVCNKATLLGWTVVVGNETNHVLYVTPKAPNSNKPFPSPTG